MWKLPPPLMFSVAHAAAVLRRIVERQRRRAASRHALGVDHAVEHGLAVSDVDLVGVALQLDVAVDVAAPSVPIRLMTVRLGALGNIDRHAALERRPAIGRRPGNDVAANC